MSQEVFVPEFPAQTDTKHSERFLIGNGYALEWKTKTMLMVSLYGIPSKTIVIREGIDRRRLAVELVLECGVSKSKLAEALNVSRQSIDNWINTYKKAGFEGLINSTKTGGTGRPRGNKARQLEAERKQAREEAQRQQLSIEFQKDDERGDDTEGSEVFDETYDFQENRYAGGFLYWGIFQHRFNFMELCESFYGKLSVVVYLFAMMLVQRINSVEGLKTIFKREFGTLLGIGRLWSKPVLWTMIHAACGLKSSAAFLRGFFHRQARKGVVALGWLYLDGHFIPYYGKDHLHKGYYTQRGQMMAGQTEMYVHDVCGQIVYVEAQEGKGDLKGMMRRVSEEWAAYIGESSPLIVVDREGWGVEHFLSLQGCRFVTWEKWSKAEELAAIPDEAFGAAFTLHERLYQAYEEQKEYRDQKGNCISLRRIVIWNRSSGKRSACVAPLEVQEESTTIACAMLGRWGCSENSFKWMGSRWNMHYNPVLASSQDSERQEIVNPEHRRLKQEAACLKKELATCERQLGQIPMTTKNDGTLRKSKKRERFQHKRVVLKEKLMKKEEEFKACPERVEINEADSDTRFKVLDWEGKNLWNIAQALAWNSRKQLIDMVSMSLLNTRDQIPVVEAMTRGRGWVRSTSEAVEVRLEPLETPRFKAAQIQLCRALNDMEIRLGNGKRLLYDVGTEPENVQKNSP